MAKLLNDRIKQKRLAAGLTLLEVADYLGVKEATVQRYESGNIKNIKYERICKLAELFHCSPTWLMGFELPSQGESEAVASAIGAGLFSEPLPTRAEASAGDDAQLSREAAELLRIYEALDVRRRVSLLAFAYKLEEGSASDGSV